ncbi:MAG: thioredoxin-like domain-containing protein [Planctomycetota bacterium]
MTAATLPLSTSFVRRVVMSLVGAMVLALTVSSGQLSAQEPKAKKPAKAPSDKASDDKPAADEGKEKAENPFPNRFPAPELDGGVEWLNTGGPISMKDLRGKIVLLDFWTFCCINCMHVLPDLEFLEKKYGREIVVIGVHSAKFDNEKETGNIRKAILRYEIEHPVINDANMIVWRKFGVRAWPSLVLVDPEGQYCGYVSGEGNRELLDAVVQKLIAYHKAKGTLDETPVKFDLERSKAADSPLRFPGKVLADAAGKRLFISDSNHNRIVVSSLEGKLLDVIGSGAIGSKDGSYSDAQFDHPQGMTLIGDTLYLADTENHQLRTVDLVKKTVSTLAGTGEQARTRPGGGKLRATALNSPWDLCAVDRILYVAMAGPHQIWAHKLGSSTIWPYAGSGREDIQNGELDEGALAQPSGITTDGKNLFVVDSEGSSVREITTDPNNDLSEPKGKISTPVGPHSLPNGRTLFEFGDVDGAKDEARFQHPLGILFHNGGLFVADSYNHKLKFVDLKTRESITWLGTGKSGTNLSPVQFAEPAGLAIADGTLYVADTNNQRIVAVDLASKKAREFPIEGLAPPQPVADPHTADSKFRTVELAAQQIASSSGITFNVKFALPEGYKLNPLLPVTYRLGVEGEQSLIDADQLNRKTEATTDGESTKFHILVANKTGRATLLVTLTYGYCRDGKGGLCKVDSVRFKLPVELAAKAEAKSVTLKVSPK